MSERVSRMILLCEDDEQEQLVRSYMKRCGLRTDPPYLLPRNASREVHGGNVGWVLQEFPKELQACRRRHASHANTMLVVVVDADEFPVAERERHLRADPPPSAHDPLIVLIPRRHVETWIRAARGLTVNETDDYKKPPPKRSEIREAAAAIYDWTRSDPLPELSSVPSLGKALPAWRKIG